MAAKFWSRRELDATLDFTLDSLRWAMLAAALLSGLCVLKVFEVKDGVPHLLGFPIVEVPEHEWPSNVPRGTIAFGNCMTISQPIEIKRVVGKFVATLKGEPTVKAGFREIK